MKCKIINQSYVRNKFIMNVNLQLMQKISDSKEVKWIISNNAQMKM